MVDSCVNQVGVNVNTASYQLLAHVSGIGPGLAQRDRRAPRARRGCSSRATQLLEVPRFSKKTFEQAAGFLRMPDGAQPARQHRRPPGALRARSSGWRRSWASRRGRCWARASKLVKQARDAEGRARRVHLRRHRARAGEAGPRSARGFVPFAFRDDIHELKDLQPGMVCPGIVTNVTNFGAFVDIGVHQDGLVHISQLADKFVKDPREVVSAGDRVTRARPRGQARQEADRADDEERSASESRAAAPPPSVAPAGRRPPACRAHRGRPRRRRRRPARAVQQPVRRRARESGQAP